MSAMVKVDPHRCISSGNCADLVPDVFSQDPEDGVVILLAATPEGSLRGVIEEAVALCPARAISLSG